MDYLEVQHRLKTAKIWSKKQLGQHFLVDEAVLEVIIQSANLNKTDTVLEIGPGLGVLSRALLKRGGKVVAFEYDPDMVAILKEDIPALRVISGDVLQTAPAVLSEISSYKVVANIPYQITTPLLRLFLEADRPPQSLTLLVQKEVAERLAAGPARSGRGYLSVMAEYFSQITYVETVPKAAFFPVPAVDSAIIHLEIKRERTLKGSEEAHFLRFVHRSFTQPRKQLKNVLAGIWGVAPEEVQAYFEGLGFSSHIRAQELSLEDWLTLFTYPFVL